MRRARGVRVSSTRDICVFCATRQLAVDGASHPLTALAQRRRLNSSSRAPQHADAQAYKEESAPPRPLTQAERMRQQLMKMQQQAAPPSPQPRAPQLSQGEMLRVALQNPPSARPRPQQSQQRPPPRRQPSNFFEGPGRNQSNQRYAPIREQRDQREQRDFRPSRYNVNMDSRPPLADAPQFGSTGHLRRRNDSFPPRPALAAKIGSPQEAQDTRGPPPPKRLLDQDELSRLLGNNSSSAAKEPPKAYTPLSRYTPPRTASKCFTCGEEGHRSTECPNRATLGQPTRMDDQFQPSQRVDRAEGSLTDAAGSWIQKQRANNSERQQMERPVYDEGRGRRDLSAFNNRRSRFMMDEDTSTPETRNRYEEPERRARGLGSDRRRRVVRNYEEEEDEGFVDRAERKRRQKQSKREAQLAKVEPTKVVLPEYISVANLAGLLKLRVEDFVRKLEDLGFEDVQNDHILNAEHAALIAQEYNFDPIVQTEDGDGDLYAAPALSPEDYAQLPARPPVVTIMGHVDHGKTTILDYMRNSSVAASEFGGITQHIGAFSVPLASGEKITFLDTPGHAAFETMRARGANVTDIVVLVVAADDSVMPQTVEAIKHAQAAKVPIIVAINKIDKLQADPDRVKLDLGRHGLDVEDFGGDIQVVCVSGKTGKGISDLEDAIVLQSEMLDHRADPQAKIEGWVLEGTTKKSGRVATVLVRSGTLRQGDILVAGTTWTRVRSLRNEAGVVVNEVGPGMPVEVDGWREQPIAGDEVLQAADEQQANEVSNLRMEKVERLQMAKDMEAINESRRAEAERREAEKASEAAAARAAETGEDVVEATKQQESGPEIVSFIVKADVSGSVEAVVDSISAVGNNEVGARILRHGVGSPSEFDVQHAADAKGHIVNFNTAIPPAIAAMAEEKGVKIMDSNIIYRVVENVKALLSEKLPPKLTQRVTGEAEVAAIFEIGLGGKKKMKVAGSKVRNGVVDKGTKAKVLRKDKVVFDGVLTSLKNQKKDVDQMRKDTECGIAFEGWEDFQVGDKVQCYEEKSEKRSL